MDISDITDQELWHFAIHCAETGRHDHAIIYLKKLIKIEVNNIDALILLSSEYAEIKMFDESLLILNKCRTLTNSPLPQFQICLLLVVQNKQVELDFELQELMKLAKDNAFYYYASILNFLNQDKLDQVDVYFSDARSCENQNEFIEKNLLSIYKNLNNQIPEAELNKEKASNNLEQSMFLSAYNDN